MNMATLNDQKSHKYLETLGFRSTLTAQGGKMWDINNSSNRLMAIPSVQGEPWKTADARHQNQYIGQLIAYQQFKPKENILLDKAPGRFGGHEKVADTEEHYDDTLEAIIYFYFPYYIKKDTQLM